MLETKTIALVAGCLAYERENVARATAHVKDVLVGAGYAVGVIQPGQECLGTLQPSRVGAAFVVDAHADPAFVIGSTLVDDMRPVLERAGIPYTGCDHIAGAVCRNKVIAKRAMLALGISTPRHMLASQRNYREVAASAVEVLGLPVVIKPVCEGNAIGLRFCAVEGDVAEILRELTASHDEVLIEPFVPGKEITVAVLGRGSTCHALTPLEVDLQGAPVYDVGAKAETAPTPEFIPARCDTITLRNLQKAAEQLHRRIGCAGATRVDFRVGSKGDIICLEINGAPNLGPNAHVAMCAVHDGMTYSAMLLSILQDAVNPSLAAR